MADDDVVEGSFDDAKDPRLAERFDALMRVPAPDTWRRAGDGPGSRGRPSRLVRWVAAAAAVALIAVVSALAVRNDGGDERVASGGGAPVTSASPSSSLSGGECDLEELVRTLNQGLPTYDYEASESPLDLAARSEMIVRGELIGAAPGGGGTDLTVRVLDSVSGDGQEVEAPDVIRTDAEAPGGELRGEFVAFLWGEVGAGAGDRRVMSVDIEGLWVACDLHSPALPALVAPVEPGWESVLSGGVTLDELWQHVRYPNGRLVSELAGPSVVEDGAAVYDLRLADGDRFRLSLPESLAGEWTLIQRPAPAPIELESDRGGIEIHLAGCPVEGPQDHNALGSVVSQHEQFVAVCRPAERLGMTVFVPRQRVRDLDTLDLRIIEVGGRYGAELASAEPRLADCSNCAPWGPMTTDAGVVVNSTGPTRVSAVDAATLAHVWTYDSGRGDVRLHGGPDGVYVSALGERFAKLDAATGEEQWRVELGGGEEVAGLDGHPEDARLLRSWFREQAQTGSPLLRRIDVRSGEVVWTASGDEGSIWHPSATEVIDGVAVAVAVDLTDGDPGAPGFESRPAAATLVAFDVATGQRAWATSLGGTARIRGMGYVMLAELEAGPALLARTDEGGVVRVDPANGELLWRSSVPGGLFTGTEYARDGSLAVHLSTPAGDVLLDPATGEQVAPPDGGSGFDCPVTRPPEDPFVPPEPWPSTPANSGMAWYGTDELWTVVGRDGYVPRKSVWWSADFRGGQQEPTPQIEVVYERLDAEAEPIVLGGPGTNAFTTADGWFMIAGIEPGVEPATTGCWRATATYEGATLSYVYEVG